MEDEGLKREEINDWAIMKRKALAAIEDLKIQWNYEDKKRGKKKPKIYKYKTKEVK